MVFETKGEDMEVGIFLPTTEVLTDDGWKSFDAVNSSDMVLQAEFDQGIFPGLSFVHPLRSIRTQFCGNINIIQNGEVHISFNRALSSLKAIATAIEDHKESLFSISVAGTALGSTSPLSKDEINQLSYKTIYDNRRHLTSISLSKAINIIAFVCNYDPDKGCWYYSYSNKDFIDFLQVVALMSGSRAVVNYSSGVYKIRIYNLDTSFIPTSKLELSKKYTCTDLYNIETQAGGIVIRENGKIAIIENKYSRIT